MTTKHLTLCAVALVMVIAGSPVRSHHSANAEFDTQKELTITGTLLKIENVNPHSWWHVEVKGADGKATAWKLESLSPAGLIRQGLKVKTDLKIGDTYTYRISPAWKDPTGEKLGFMRSITVNGKEFIVVEL